MAVLEAEYAAHAELLAVLPVGPEMSASSEAIRAISTRMDELMGVTPEARRAEALEEFAFYTESAHASAAA